MLLRFCDDAWTPSFITTIGIDFKIRTIEVDGKRIKLQIVSTEKEFLLTGQWDTAGQERFRTITTAYYRGSMGILLVFDVTDEKSFQSAYLLWCIDTQTSETGTRTCCSTPAKVHARSWSATNATGRRSGYVTRHTRTHPQAVSAEQAQELANELGMQYIETSAKSNINVDEAFFKLAKQVKDHLADQGITSNVPGAGGSQTIGGSSNLGATGQKGGCC